MTSTRSAMAQLKTANPVITTRSPAATRSPAPRHRSRVGLLVAATAGASAVALVVVAVGLPQGAATPAAAAALDRAATAADITAWTSRPGLSSSGGSRPQASNWPSGPVMPLPRTGSPAVCG